ncbi:MAG: hypothetical protein U1E14_01360 [Geminicoccaceae bacterium]
MGLPAGVRIGIAKAIGQHLFDAPLAQAIVNVEAETAPTAVRVRFRTLLPTWATVEVFRMITGTIDLDMEPENLVATNVELFGNASTEHDVPVFGLEQERRYWYRISVPRKSPAEPKAKGQVRARGPFATRRQMLTIDISRIHLYDDSDDSSRGDLLFSAAFYDATRPRGRASARPGFSAKLYRSSGDDIDIPFPSFPPRSSGRRRRSGSG